MISSRCRSGLLLALTAASALAQPEAINPLVDAELERVRQSQSLSYRATLILSSGNQLESLRIGPDGLQSGDGSARSLHRTEEALTLSVNGTPQLQLGQRGRLLPGASSDPAQLAQGYRIRVLPLDRVDLREALPLQFDPVDRWRYGSTLWIDRETGLVTKTEVRDLDQRPLAQSMLTHLEVLGERSPEVLPEPPAQLSAHWQVQGLPSGFEVMQVIREGESEQLLVSDGIAVVSVFVEPLAAGVQAQNGIGQRGLLATIAQIRGDYQLVALGVVPTQTIQRILNGVTRRQ